MRRAVARWQTAWVRLFVLAVLAGVLLPIPRLPGLAGMIGLFLLFLVRPPLWERGPVEVAAPVQGRWVAINSPGSAVPSHGVKAYGQMYAVDLLQSAPDAPTTIGWGLRPRRPQTFPSFGQPVLAMAPGAVIRVRDGQRDHGSRHTWPLVLWMMIVEGFVRELAGVSSILGNHVVIEHDDGTYAAYAHLRRGSARVRDGERVQAGEQIGEVGNTGNTSEPHLHVQLMDRARPTAAAGVPMTWRDAQVDPTDRDPRWESGPAKASAQPLFAENGQVVHVL